MLVVTNEVPSYTPRSRDSALCGILYSSCFNTPRLTDWIGVRDFDLAFPHLIHDQVLYPRDHRCFAGSAPIFLGN